MSDPQAPSPCTVLVAGAGPVGLTCAAHLHQHGLPCRIIDKAPQPSDKSKALALWGRSLEMLDHLGVVNDFLGAGLRMQGARLYGGSRQLVHIPLEAAGTEYPKPLMLAQCETERLLTEHLRRAGIAPERPVELIDFTDHGDHVLASLRHGDGRDEQVRCDWLIGCDGAHSTVRKKLGQEFTGEADPNDWILADLRLEGPIALDEVSIFWHSKGVIAVFPFARDRCRIIADMGPAKNTAKAEDPTLEQVQAVVNERGPAGVRLFEPHWLAGFRINERKVKDYRRGRVFLCGDAAHIHSPAGGQGMNTGMQDTWNLVWKLALVQNGRGRPALLDSFSPERSAIGDKVLRDAGAMTRVALLRNPLGRFFRDNLLWLFGHLAAFRRFFVRNLAELTIHYPSSPLNAETAGHGWASGSVRPGDRVPDLRLREPSTGHAKRLHDWLRGTTWNLLLLPSGTEGTTLATLRDICQRVEAAYAGVVRSHLVLPAATAPAALEGFPSVCLDPQGFVRGFFGAHETALALVRPDGYLAYRGQPAGWAELGGYLEKFLNPRT